jgi:hypothetical protein
MILVVNFIATLIAIVLPLAAILDAPGLVLGPIVAGCAGPARIGRARSA